MNRKKSDPAHTARAARINVYTMIATSTKIFPPKKSQTTPHNIIGPKSVRTIESARSDPQRAENVKPAQSPHNKAFFIPHSPQDTCPWMLLYHNSSSRKNKY